MKSSTPKILALVWTLATPLFAQNDAADPFAGTDLTKRSKNHGPEVIQLTYEAFSSCFWRRPESPPWLRSRLAGAVESFGGRGVGTEEKKGGCGEAFGFVEGPLR